MSDYDSWKTRTSPNQRFFKKSTSYWPPAQSTRTKMTANGFSSYELFVKIDTFSLTLRLKVVVFHGNQLFHFQPLKNRFKGILCSEFIIRLLFLFHENRPARTQFQMCPFSANTRSQKSRTPPDRSATPYYLESFRFQPSSMEWKFKISQLFSKTLPRKQISGLTADSLNSISNFQAGC